MKDFMKPNKNDTQLCRMYDETATCKINTETFINNIKSQIDFFQTKLSDFDVLVIYIPKSFAKFREDNAYDPDFNLHDAIKLYRTNKGVKIQFIEERSLDAYDKCKVMWALSTSLYAKASAKCKAGCSLRFSSFAVALFKKTVF